MMELLIILLIWAVVGKATWKGFWHSTDAWTPDK